MARMQEKVSVLGGSSRNGHERPPRPTSATSQRSASQQRPRSAAQAHSTSGSVTGEEIQQLASKKDKHQQALKLWREWAVDALGPMTSEPTPEELQTKSKRIKHLERKCAELAARAQQRLEASAMLRGPGSISSPSGARSGSTARPASAGASFQQTMWAARETRKSKTYEAARDLGRNERAQSANNAGAKGRPVSASAAMRSPSASTFTAGHGGSQTPAAHGSHSLLEALLSGAAIAPAASGPGASAYTPPGGGARQRPQSARFASHTSPSPGPRSSSPSTSGGPWAASPGPHQSYLSPGQGPGAASGAYSPGPMTGPSGGAAGRQSKAAQLQAEAETLRVQLDEARATVESQAEVEAQLRDTIDLLRARLHGQSQREVENQRRLQQHTRLEPLFDRLAETFTFKTPEEVVERLEMLEDDKLGTFDQLLLAQEEVAALQSQLREANKRVETARTQATTDSIRSASRLQQQNEELRAELESVESLNSRLTQRQELLVQLQSAVMDLWGRCQADPAFLSANADDDGAAAGKEDAEAGPRRGRSLSPGKGGATMRRGAGGAGSMSRSASRSPSRAPSRSRTGTRSPDRLGSSTALTTSSSGAESMQNLDPLSVMALIKEYVIARSPVLASRHYLDSQRVANRVWSHHFRHKSTIRGKVVETFEQLSTMADMMASKVKAATEQLQRSKDNERFLAASLKKVETQRRSLEHELEHRNQLVRDMSGIPRKQRPMSAVARTLEVVGPEALLHMRASTSAAAMAATASAAAQGSGLGSSSAAGSVGGRPQSAPAKRPQSAQQPPRGPQAPGAPGGAGASYRQVQAEGKGGATPRAPRPMGSGPATPERSVHLSQGPVGDHWGMFGTALQSSQSHGALMQGGNPVAGALAVATAAAGGSGAKGSLTGSGSPGSGAWTPPKKSAIEASFLARLQRSASCRG